MIYEDEVRDIAKEKLGFNDGEENVRQGVGQLRTFNQLGFTKGHTNYKPDGWYLPNDKNKTAIILETKNSNEDVEYVTGQIQKYVDTVLENGYKTVIGIVFNGVDVAVYKNGERLEGMSNNLENKAYYLYSEKREADTEAIQSILASINHIFNYELMINNFYHRMIFTGCALVANYKYGASLNKLGDEEFNVIRQKIRNSIDKNFIKGDSHDTLLSAFDDVVINANLDCAKEKGKDNPITIFVNKIQELCDFLDNTKWHELDVMGVFFNEFNRYKKKSEKGQVFTPEHIASFMYRLIDVKPTDNVGDFTCGSGMFLTKSLGRMINAAGGIESAQSQNILKNQLFGIEYDKTICALAIINMIMHDDGYSNIKHLDTRYDEAKTFIENSKITKVLMNPPYERGNGCIDIVKNVLDSVEKNADCAFLLPDKKLEKDSKKKINEILKHHRIITIIKLPNETFDASTSTSIFIFKAHEPQNNKEIFTCKIDNDGLIRIKNKGRHDIANKWHGELEDYWLNVIEKHKEIEDGKNPWINPNECLSYQETEQSFEISEEDFLKTMMNFEMFNDKIDVDILREKMIDNIMYFEGVE